MKTLERIDDFYAFEHRGMNIGNPIMSECGRGAVDPEEYGFEVVWTGGGCSCHAQNFMLNGESVLMVMTDGDINAVSPDSKTAMIAIYRTTEDNDAWDLLPENMITFYEVTR